MIRVQIEENRNAQNEKELSDLSERIEELSNTFLQYSDHNIHWQARALVIHMLNLAAGFVVSSIGSAALLLGASTASILQDVWRKQNEEQFATAFRSLKEQ